MIHQQVDIKPWFGWRDRIDVLPIPLGSSMSLSLAKLLNPSLDEQGPAWLRSGPRCIFHLGKVEGIAGLSIPKEHDGIENQVGGDRIGAGVENIRQHGPGIVLSCNRKKFRRATADKQARV